MIKILLIEDDGFKAKSICDFVNIMLINMDIKIVSSLVEAINSISQEVYDLVLVDMAIPSHPIVSGGGAPMSLLTGGLDVLLELNSLDRNDQCVIITQYPEIEISGQFFSVQRAGLEIKKQLNCDVLACIEYSEGADDWKKALGKVLKQYESFNS